VWLGARPREYGADPGWPPPRFGVNLERHERTRLRTGLESFDYRIDGG
jgi:hypothetical protein